MNSLFRRAALPFFLLLLFVGCNKSGPSVVPVKGIATRDGQPIKNLLITLYPEEGKGRPSTGMTDDEGRFELKYDKDTKGAVVGMHKVVVAFRPRNLQEELDLEEGNFSFHPDKDAILEKYGERFNRDGRRSPRGQGPCAEVRLGDSCE